MDRDRYSGSVDAFQAHPMHGRDYVALRRALGRAIGRVCPAWLVEQREDIVQVAMTKVVRVMEAGKAAEAITPAYLSRVAYHAVVDEIRRQRRRRCVTAVEESVEDGVAAEEPSPESVAAGRQVGVEIRDCMGRMARSRRLAR